MAENLFRKTAGETAPERPSKTVRLGPVIGPLESVFSEERWNRGFPVLSLEDGFFISFFYPMTYSKK
ncbi:MAG TPA: hypothetical protein VHR47_09045 [Bacillota bacterium]|nr:hypothetical protein [Bacillota bacterium]